MPENLISYSNNTIPFFSQETFTSVSEETPGREIVILAHLPVLIACSVMFCSVIFHLLKGWCNTFCGVCLFASLNAPAENPHKKTIYGTAYFFLPISCTFGFLPTCHQFGHRKAES